MIPYYRLSKQNSELKALKEIHERNAWVIGEDSLNLENELKKLFNKKFIVLTSNGYSALFLSIKALGLKGQKIIIPAISTCFAITNAVIASGNEPVFCDVNLKDGNCSLESVKILVQKTGAKIIISPDHAGNISQIKDFKDLGLLVIQDACQSFFSSIDKQSLADAQVFSFYPTKGINGIDGGVIATNNEDLARKAKKMLYYDDQVVFENEERYNFRFLNICAAVALSNLADRHGIVEKLKVIEKEYNSILSASKQISPLKNNAPDVLHRYVISIIDPDLEQKIKSAFESKMVNFRKFFNWICPQNALEQFPNSRSLVNTAYCIPYYEDLQTNELETISTILKDVIT